MEYDFNHLEKVAKSFMECGNFEDAAAIYYFMSDGDSSLDAGYLGHRLGICYEKMGRLQAAKYWYGRAVEENPEVDRYHEAKTRLAEIDVEDLLNRVSRR